MGTYEVNFLFALLIGVLASLSLSNFFRKGGPWTKRSRMLAMVRLRTNRFLKKRNSRGEPVEESQVVTMSWLFWVLVISLLLTITITVLQYS